MDKRVALISEHASPLACLGGVDSGGQNVYVSHLARQLAWLGWEVDVFTRRDSPLVPMRVPLAPRVRVVHVPAGPPEFVPKEDLFTYMDEFAAWMWRHGGGYALNHANFWMSAYVAAELRQPLRRPFAVTFHALGEVRRRHQGSADRFPDERLPVERRVIQDADLIIAECPQDQEDQVAYYGADPARMRIVPCGFDPAELWPVSRREAREHIGLDERDTVILHVGRIVPRKGIDNTIRGFGRLVTQHGHDARLLIVGGESDVPDFENCPEFSRLAAIAREEQVSDRVTFFGRRDRDVLKYFYSAADVFVTTPWYEPFGITPLEAMACGTPVVGSDVGGIRYTVCHGVTGFRVPPNDPDSLADALLALVGDPFLRRSMGVQARKRVLSHFTWSQVASQIAQAYEWVLCRQEGATRPRPLKLHVACADVEAGQSVEQVIGNACVERAVANRP